MDFGEKEGVIGSTSLSPSHKSWLEENGPKELELLFRAIVFHPSAPILLTDDNRHSHDASVGAGKLLGVAREEIIGRALDDFSEPALKPEISARWRAFLEDGQQEGTLQIVTPDKDIRNVEYAVKPNILPVRHLVVLHDKAAADKKVPTWVQDYALSLLDLAGNVVAWYAGAERIYGYGSAEASGQHVSLLYASDDALYVSDELKRTAHEGHSGMEGWQVKKDGSRFWASTVTMALKNETGEPQGFARIVRDFSDRHERDEKLRRSLARNLPAAVDSTIAGVVSGEFDRIPEANDTFLEMVGYTRDDLQTGRLRWPELTPPEYIALDEVAHEEGLRFGACTPFEKEFIRKDGTRIPVLIATAVLKLSPFRWITFVKDLRARDRVENVAEPAAKSSHAFDEMIGDGLSMKRVLAQVELVAPTDATVLILGETGTGKELVARAIHRVSPRRNLPFISLNCAAIPTGLLESELFGYERGAFTGALGQKIGRFEMANRGTLFLDEVGDIPLDLQPKLLRALQEKSFERLGGTRTIPIDVRLVAATNRNLTEMMNEKLFRSDLYYRLKVFPVTTPPLRDRPEDIPLLARHFVRKYAAKMNRTIDTIPTETMRAFTAWTWPGNIRELENFIERSVILSPGNRLQAPLAELFVEPAISDGTPGSAVLQENGSNKIPTLEEVEREHIIRVLRETRGVVSTAAALLGVPRTTLNAMMKKLGISRTAS